ncbi:MAG: glycine--tRNA ligase subunit beta [Myxococcales bacterium]|nr:glycine--tRNA ligase subunit beta [Myxococcales bacterium]
MPNLLLEVGCEEIPARQLDLALGWLAAQVPVRLAAARIDCGEARVLGTPRRLAVLAHDVALMARDQNETVVGPSVSAAFAADGSPTKAAQAFASKNGLDLAACTRAAVEGKKGEYLIGSKTSLGGPTMELLPGLLAALISDIPWAKSMRWGDGEARFVRPVHWLLTRFGAELVPVSWGGVHAGGTTRGHRFLAPEAIEVADADAYVATLRQASVLVDVSERKAAVEAELARAAAAHGVAIVPDAGLLAEVCNLVEYPRAVVGTFAADYLEVPAAVIITAMRTHQRYFAVTDAAGALAPAFVTIAGTPTNSDDVVRRGNETVLASRLSDAQYFFKLDKRTPLATWNQKLAAVVFQAKLGDAAKTYAHKVARVTALAEAIARRVGADVDVVRAAAGNCKADLMSGVVGEFPELQGAMGNVYATPHLGAAVGAAIEQHYWPKGAGAALPLTPEAAVVSVADRLDTLVGCFASGLEPTGSADPYGLRRATLGVLAIVLDRAAASPAWRLKLSELVDGACGAFGESLVIRRRIGKRCWPSSKSGCAASCSTPASCHKT